MKHLSKHFIVLALIVMPIFSKAQSDYIKFAEDSIVKGYIRFYTDINTGEQLIEFWQSKNQSKGVRYPKSEIDEYGIGKDRYLILKNFQPIAGEDFFFETIETKVIESGTIELMHVPDPTSSPRMTNNPASGQPGSIPVGKSTIDVIRFPKKNITRAVPTDKDKFSEFMQDLFSEKAISAFEKEKGKLAPGKLRKFVKFYNEKTARKVVEN